MMAARTEQSMEKSQNIKKIVESLERLPTLPAVAVRVNELLRSPMAGIQDLARVIENDLSITANILSLVNSAYYGLGRKISNIKDAIGFLGSNAISQMVMGLGVMRCFGSDGKGGFGRDEFWLHSIATGVLTRKLAKAAGYRAVEDAFTAGLLHDIGKLALATCCPDLVASVSKEVALAPKAYHRCEREALGLDHGNVGEWVSRKWELPLLCIVAIRHHHESPADRTGFNLSNDPVIDIVSVADWLAHSGKLGYSGSPQFDTPAQEIFERARTDQESALKIMESSRTEIISTALAMGIGRKS
jgi:HD-like signal output (HDOD) protein